jgi:putative ABC transport system permease protein
VTGLSQDLRYALRQLGRAPGFTAVAVLTLALGIGATSAIFSMVNAVLLRPLPYREPAELMMLHEARPDGTRNTVSFPNFADWRAQDSGFRALAIVREQQFVLTGGTSPERVPGALVSADFLRVFGLEPVAGRLFAPGEDRAGRDGVAVISYGLWQGRFGGGGDAIGRTLVVDGRSVTVVGVAPAGFRYPSDADVWIPVSRDIPDLLSNRGLHAYEVVGRLRSGATAEAARARLAALAEHLAREYPATNRGWGVVVAPLHAALVKDVRPTLLVLFGAVAFLLLIASVNVANMMLARATVRRHELSIRTALGASQGRLVRQLLTESLVIALAGGALGLLLATWGLSGLAALGPPQLAAHGAQPTLDGPVVAFTLAVAILTSLVFGLVPAFQAARRDPEPDLRLGRGAGGTEQRRTRRLLVAAEIALSLLLLVGAGLMGQSFLRLQAVDPGFRSDGVVTARVSAARSDADTARVLDFYRNVVRRLAALPGVTNVAAVSYLPLGQEGARYRFLVEGQPPVEPQLRPGAEFFTIMPGYFATLGIPLLQGRDVGPQDRWDGPGAVVINASMARRFWPGQSALGRRITFGEPGDDDWLTVAGVVPDVKQRSLVGDPQPQVYAAQSQVGLEEMAVVVRSGGDPRTVARNIRQAVGEVDPNVPVSDVRTLEDIRRASISTDRFRTLLIGSFATAALLLAAIGVYGVIAYGVAQRVREIGIRVALGARRPEIVRLVIGEGMRPVAAGVVAGVVLAAGLSRFLGSLLYGVRPLDLSTFAAVALVLSGVALAACALPARRASRVSPMHALRSE